MYVVYTLSVHLIRYYISIFDPSAETRIIVSYSVVPEKGGLGPLDNSDVQLGKGFVCNNLKTRFMIVCRNGRTRTPKFGCICKKFVVQNRIKHKMEQCEFVSQDTNVHLPSSDKERLDWIRVERWSSMRRTLL
jgi:hypothetical protein